MRLEARSDMLIRLMGSVEEVKENLNILYYHEYLEICRYKE